MSLNSVVLMGRMVQEPELRSTQNGIPVCAFCIAVERDFKAKGGERETDFVDVIAWRNSAEFVSKYVRKGTRVCVQGRLQFRNWVDKEGNKRRTAEVEADNIYFADGKKDAPVEQTNRKPDAGFSEDEPMPF